MWRACEEGEGKERERGRLNVPFRTCHRFLRRPSSGGGGGDGLDDGGGGGGGARW